jgi:hypothetical protein
MIEMQGNQTETGIDPWDQSNDQQLDNSWESYMGTLGQLLVEFRRFSQYSERQREKAAPTVVDLSPSSGAQVANTYSTKTKLRLQGVLLSGGATVAGVGDRFNLRAGTLNYVFFADGAGSSLYIPFPIEVDRGIDLSMNNITTPASTAWSCYVIAYPE